MSAGDDRLIRRLAVFDASLPLSRPYGSVIATISSLDTFLIEIVDAAGRAAWGEAAIYPGYAQESREDAVALWRRLLPGLVGRRPDAALGLALAHVDRQPHAVAALASALELLAMAQDGRGPRPCRHPILEAVAGRTEADLAGDVEAAIARGFRVLKLKIGYDVEADLRRVATVSRAAAGAAAIRLDANQGYSREDALRFVGRLDPAGIELLEQPCAEADWAANGAVAARSPVPVMLDESIYGADDIRAAADLAGVSIVKLKLVKAGSIGRLRGLAALAHGASLKVVIGNGVACELGCAAEALVAADFPGMAGEMNGFLKLADSPFRGGALLDRSEIVTGCGPAGPPVDRALLARHARAIGTFGRN